MKIKGLDVTMTAACVSLLTIAGLAACAEPVSEYPKPAVVVTGDSYADCLALADIDGFAPEVCEPLSPTEPTEVTVTDITCPQEDSCTIDYRNGAWHIKRVTS